MNKELKIVIAVIGAFFLFLLGLMILNLGKTDKENTGEAKIQSDGSQIITISVKGGYSPSVIKAKANTKTTIRFKTNGTFDCSSAIVIPSLNFRKSMKATETYDLEIEPQSSGKVIDGTCTMGMYSFKIKFE